MHRFFVVTLQAEWVYDGEVVVGRRPVALAHAKEMGTSRTACGVACATWEKLWDEAFPVRGGPNCPACLEIVSGLGTPNRR